jgi:hypothetical protein
MDPHEIYAVNPTFHPFSQHFIRQKLLPLSSKTQLKYDVNKAK